MTEQPTNWRCRRCQTPIDGDGNPCPGCGQKQRVPFALPNGAILHLDPLNKPQIEGMRLLLAEGSGRG